MAIESRRDDRHAAVVATVTQLIAVADGDTLYRDAYLGHAAHLLEPVVGESAYEDALRRRDQLTRLLAQARAAVTREDWPKVRDLGMRAADLQTSLDAEQDVLTVAGAVYAAPPVALDPLSPGLTGFAKRWTSAAQAKTELLATLHDLDAHDPAARHLYRARERAMDAIVVPEAAATASGASLSETALQAIERGDATTLRALAESITGRRPTAPVSPDSTTATRAVIEVPAVLGEPLPEACRAGASRLGLEPVEVKLVSPGTAAAINDFLADYALWPSAAAFDRSRDGVTRLTLAAGEIDVPRDLVVLFAETLSLFALHLYVNSAGIRYVPLPTSEEPVLVETHAEGEEARTPLLHELGLGQRRGLARSAIEAALHRRGAHIVAEQLGLDPLAFRLVCIPPDVYMRIGRERGWGAREEWTHFDGYQVMSGGRLRALVGGNARFGGAADLCSISTEDARENTVVRFAVVRRERLGVRIG